MHYYKRNIGDYAKKTGRLSMLEHGAYTLLIDACYDRERFPTLDEAIEWTWARSDEEISAVKFILSRFFKRLDDGRYIQDRIREEVEKYQENSKTNKRIAIEREKARREKQNCKRTVRADTGTVRDDTGTVRDDSVNGQCTDEHEPPPNQEPRTTNQEPLTSNTPCSPPQGDGLLELVKSDSAVSDPREGQWTPAEQIFLFWKSVMNRDKKTKFTDGRKRKVLKRLENFTVEDIHLAIMGCASSDHHMGRNPRSNPEGTVYDELTLICRSDEKLEEFIRRGKQAQQQAGQSGQLSAWIQAGQGETIDGEAEPE